MIKAISFSLLQRRIMYGKRPFPSLFKPPSLTVPVRRIPDLPPNDIICLNFDAHMFLTKINKSFQIVCQIVRISSRGSLSITIIQALFLTLETAAACSAPPRM